MKANPQENPGFGIKPKEDEYERYVGKPIRIYSVNTCYLGVLNSMVNGNLFLLPAYISENLYNFDGSLLPRARIERKIPTIVPRSGVTGVESLGENYLEKLARHVNNIKPKEGLKNPSIESNNTSKKPIKTPRKKQLSR